MVKKYRIKIITLLVLCFAVLTSKAQSPEDVVKKDYSRLYKDFKIQLGKQKAHYIIAIDVSSSMKSMEAAVKANLKNFIAALPNGDKITLIQMASRSETQVVNLIEYTDIDNTTRTDISKYIEGLKYKKNNESGDGSDGFTMTELILKALNASGSSNDMKYVFVFSDLEFYDKNSHTRSNGYNKNAMPWKSLEGKLKKDEEKYIQVYGLVIKKPTHLEAVYKSDLQRIFPNYNEVNCPDNSSILNKWFNLKKSEILNERLKKCLKNETERQNAALILKSSGIGKDIVVELKDPKMSSVYSTAELDPLSLAAVQEISKKHPWIGPFTPTPVNLTVKAKLLAPKYVNSDHPNHTPSNPYNEVERLLQPQFTDYQIEVYEGKPYLAWYIGWPLVALLGFWILSIIYHLLTYKTDKRWNLSVTLRNAPLSNVNGNELKSFDSKSFTSVPFECGQGAKDYSIEECGFKFSISSKRNILCIPFLKRGYYITKISGGEMDFVKNRKEQRISTGESLWIGSPKAAPVGAVQVKKGSDQYVIVKIL